MNQAAHAAADADVHTAVEVRGYTPSRKRPKKTLRQASDCVGNLVAFSHQPRPSAPSHSSTWDAGLSGQQTPAAHPPADRQMLASSAANNDQLDNIARAPTAATAAGKPGFRYLTLVKVLAGLAVVVIGVIWIATKTSAPDTENQEPYLSGSVSNLPVSQEPTSIEPALTNPANSDTEAAAADYAPEPDLLDEIKWLQEQNQFLQAEKERLSYETLDLNKELLDMELKLSTNSPQVEPSTEPEVVYNFVDVPIGNTVSAASDEPDQFVSTAPDEQRDQPVFNASDERDLPDLSDEVLNYDPNTGYYLNPQYDDGSDTSFGNDGTGSDAGGPLPPDTAAYPPIEYSSP